MSRKFNLNTYAKHDPAHCLVPNLFRPIKSGDRSKYKLDIEYQYGKNETLKFIGFEPLDAGDMRILQALVAMAGPSTLSLDFNDATSEIAKILMTNLSPNNNALDDNSRVVMTGLSSILAEIGLTDTGPQRKVAMKSLLRLSNVTVIAKSNNLEWSCHLLSYAHDDKTKKLFVALNPRITKAILGGKGAQYTTIDMSEVRKIKSDLSAILHQRLSAIVDAGKCKSFKTDTLLDYIWGYDVINSTDNKQSNVQRQRRHKLNNSMKEIETTGGWTFTNNGYESVLVSRKITKKIS